MHWNFSVGSVKLNPAGSKCRGTTMDKRTLILSVGNPGRSARHSVGHLGLKYLMDMIPCKQLVKPKQKSAYSMSETDAFIFVHSNTFMNESAKALKEVLEDLRLVLSQLVVIILYDDFESNIGSVKLSQFKKSESHGGIKDLKNYISKLNIDSQVFKLGIGIGPKPSNATKDTMGRWVLAPFKSSELEVLRDNSFPMLYLYIHSIDEYTGPTLDVNKINSQVKNLAT